MADSQFKILFFANNDMRYIARALRGNGRSEVVHVELNNFIGDSSSIRILSLVNEHKPDVIIIHSCGYPDSLLGQDDFGRTVKALPKNRPPIIFVSADETSRDLEYFKETGAGDLVLGMFAFGTKEVENIQELTKEVCKAMNSAKLGRP